ncbi:MAG: hypothetical protein QXG05_07965 [Nitrososphaerota archaeon]
MVDVIKFKGRDVLPKVKIRVGKYRVYLYFSHQVDEWFARAVAKQLYYEDKIPECDFDYDEAEYRDNGQIWVFVRDD